MEILIIGDSWGIGVFEHRNGVYGSTGTGIQSILESHGHRITNISKAGGSNWLMIDRLENRWDKSDRCTFGIDPLDKKPVNLQNIDIIIFLQTDIFREKHYYGKQFKHSEDTQYKILNQEFIDNLLTYGSIQEFTDQYFAEFYSKLNSIAERHSKKVLCIGGWSKLHPSIVGYGNLVPVVHSASELLMSDVIQDGHISDAEWYLQLDKNPKIMEKFGDELKLMTIDNAEKLNNMYKSWGDVHPDLSGYQQIVDRILPFLG